MPKQDDKADIVAVAKAARVSISTVSRSFNHPDLVKLATRKKIDRAVRKLGYIRNRAAQAMHGRRSGTIGLIVPTIDHAIFAEVVQSFSETVDEAGFTILMVSHGYDLMREYAVLRKLLEHRVDGVAVIGLHHAEETYQLLDQQQVPNIAIWNYDPASRMSCVGAVNLDAGQGAARHLAELGHRRIALLFPQTTDNDRATDRLRGAEAVLAASGIDVPPDWRLEAAYDIGLAKQACVEFFASGARPTALLCGNDVIAQGAVFAAAKVGLRVPEDLSIVGIGDFKGSAEMEPALTTIRIPARRIGRVAGDEIARMIVENDLSINRHKCDIQFLQRSTTRAV